MLVLNLDLEAVWICIVSKGTDLDPLKTHDDPKTLTSTRTNEKKNIK